MSYPKDSTRGERRKFAKERARKSLENELERLRPLPGYVKTLEAVVQEAIGWLSTTTGESRNMALEMKLRHAIASPAPLPGHE